MKILGVETSCDETAVAVLEFENETNFSILSEQLNSQIDIHKEYGGVYPAVAKREHTKNMYPLLFAALDQAGLLNKRRGAVEMGGDLRQQITIILERDPENLDLILKLYAQYEKPDLDAIAVTYGPGLEIALWTGFNFSKALSVMWGIEFVPTNHMEGHIYASLMKEISNGSYSLTIPELPFLSLLISGGHTELLVSEHEHAYTKIGKTLDDAVGEAYDKSARLLGIPYPGGPEISKLAEQYKQNQTEADQNSNATLALPRPMIHSGNYDFSFSGLKTAVLQLVEKQDDVTTDFKQELSSELESAIAEVLVKKTKKAITEYGIQGLVIGGGVSANNNIRSNFTDLCEQEHIPLFISPKKYTGDNAVMITIAGYRKFIHKKYDPHMDRVSGSVSLDPTTTRKG